LAIPHPFIAVLHNLRHHIRTHTSHQLQLI